MDENEKIVLETTGFVSCGIGSRRAGRAASPTERKYRSAKNAKRGGSHNGAGYLLLRLGVCAACFCGILGLKLKGDPAALAVMGNIAENNGSGKGRAAEEQLGRLKFVDLPSIIDVFAPSDKAVLPAYALSFELSDENGLLKLVTTAGSDIVSPAEGRVRLVGEDEKLGRFVSVITEEDAEFTLYGFDVIDAEQGQPVKQRQKLGEAKDSSVFVRATKSGRPIDLEKLFDLGKAG